MSEIDFIFKLLGDDHVQSVNDYGERTIVTVGGEDYGFRVVDGVLLCSYVRHDGGWRKKEISLSDPKLANKARKFVGIQFTARDYENNNQ